MKKPMVESLEDAYQYFDASKSVSVYRNLHKNCWSVQQGGRVVFHAISLVLRDFTTVVRKAGRERLLRERKKNVHAFLKGHLLSVGFGSISAEIEFLRSLGIDYDAEHFRYSPYESDFFVTDSGSVVNRGITVLLRQFFYPRGTFKRID